MLLLLSFSSIIVFAKDCPKDLGFVEVQNLKLTCFYQEFDRGGNLVVRGSFENGVKKKDWGWSKHYILSKSWPNNKIYDKWKKALEEIKTFAKDCPKDLGFVEVQNLKLTCFYQEFDEDGNLAVFGSFVDGFQKGVWEWTKFYFKNPNWKQNEHYSYVKDDFEYIEKSVDVEYEIDKNGRKIAR